MGPALGIGDLGCLGLRCGVVLWVSWAQLPLGLQVLFFPNMGTSALCALGACGWTFCGGIQPGRALAFQVSGRALAEGHGRS